MNKTILITTIIIIFGAVGIFLYSGNQQTKESSTSMDSAMENVKKTQGQPNSDKEVMVADSSTKYVDYSDTAIADATKDGGKALLFFHASWCPTCRAAEKEILSDPAEIPSNLTIIKTDYDEEIELKKKYNVTYQHTFIQVDSNGEIITQWNGGGVDEILKRIK